MAKSARHFRGNYIHGHFTLPSDPNGELKSINPGRLDEGTTDIPFAYDGAHEAAIAAKRASTGWTRLSNSDRFSFLHRYRDLLQNRTEALASSISLEVGKPIWESRLEIERTLRVFDYYLSLGSQLHTEQKVASARENADGVIRTYSRGVFAILTPAAQPIYTVHTSLVPTLVNGNTAVIKASKNAPLVGQTLSELIHESGLPPGVINVIHGDTEVSRRLTNHADVDGVYFTGSYETGFKIKKQLLSDYWKVLVLDLGGKNSIVIWDDANYEQALYETLVSAFITTGQRCHTTSRVIVHDKIFDRFVSDFHKLAKKCRIGYGMHDGKDAPFMGPLLTEPTMENYLRYQGIAVREGAEEIMRGKSLEREGRGYYVSPSIHLVVKPDSKGIYQKGDVTGPNVAIYRTSEIEEAAEFVNLTQHGLVASIYTKNREVYSKMANEVRTGSFHWNLPTITDNFTLPSGGIRRSGNARPMGSWAPAQCTYPMSSLELNSSFQKKNLPDTLPHLEE